MQLETDCGGATWHAHEMVFGHTAAVIADFLLTAVRNWTSEQTARGASLAALVGLSLAAFVVFLLLCGRMLATPRVDGAGG